MTDDDRKKFAGLLGALGELFNEPISELRATLYFGALLEFDINEVIRASQTIGKTLRFFPKPVDFIEILQGTAVDQSEMAWAELLRQIRREGHTGKPQLPSTTWHVIDELWGSWQAVCETLPAEGPELLGWAKRFKTIYGSTQRIVARVEFPFVPKELDE